MTDDAAQTEAAGNGHPAATAETAAPPAAEKGITLPYDLPSRGVFYGEKLPNGTVTMFPIRGEQEELLAGAGDGVEATPVFRSVVAQLSDLKGLAYEDLLLSDWVALLLNLLAFSYTPIVRLRPRCTYCHKFFPKHVNIEEMPCTVVKDEERDKWASAFKTDPLPFSKAVVEWKLLTLSDMIRAEEWAEQQQSTQMTPGSPLHTYTIARHIKTINGKETKILHAIDWVRQAYGRDLRALSEEFRKWETGYDLTPKFRCPHCGGTFRQKLPLDGSFFRAVRSGPGESPSPEV